MIPFHKIKNQKDVELYRQRLKRKIHRQENTLKQEVNEARASFTVGNLVATGLAYFFPQTGNYISWIQTTYNLFSRFFLKE